MSFFLPSPHLLCQCSLANVFVLAAAFSRSSGKQTQLSYSRKQAGVFCRVFVFYLSDLNQLTVKSYKEPAQGKQEEKGRS